MGVPRADSTMTLVDSGGLGARLELAGLEPARVDAAPRAFRFLARRAA